MTGFDALRLDGKRVSFGAVGGSESKWPTVS